MGLVARIPSGGASGGSTVAGVQTVTNAAAVTATAGGAAVTVAEYTWTESGPFPGGVVAIGVCGGGAAADGTGSVEAWIEVDAVQAGAKVARTQAVATGRLDGALAAAASKGALAVGSAHTVRLRIQAGAGKDYVVAAGAGALVAMLLPGGT